MPHKTLFSIAKAIAVIIVFFLIILLLVLGIYKDSMVFDAVYFVNQILEIILWLIGIFIVSIAIYYSAMTFQEKKMQMETFSETASIKGGVFISYSHTDQNMVKKITKRFAIDNINFWLDNKDLLLGQVIDKEISDGIQENLIFLTILTPSSVKSKWVTREIDEALHEVVDRDKIIIPVIANGLKYSDIPPGLRRLLSVNLDEDFDKGYELLKKSILNYLDEKFVS